jgi:hypothetical protein
MLSVIVTKIIPKIGTRATGKFCNVFIKKPNYYGLVENLKEY